MFIYLFLQSVCIKYTTFKY